MRPELIETLSKQISTLLWIIWASMIASELMLVVVAVLSSPDIGEASTSPPEVFFSVLTILALFWAAGGVALQRVLTPARLLSSRIRINTGKLSNLAQSEEEHLLVQAALRYQAGLIASLALVEVCPLLGFVATFVSGDPSYVVAAVTLGVSLTVIALRPDAAIVKRLARNLSLRSV